MRVDLPAPAQGYFRFAIRPDTALTTIANITIQGQFGPGARHQFDHFPCAGDRYRNDPVCIGAGRIVDAALVLRLEMGDHVRMQKNPP